MANNWKEEKPFVFKRIEKYLFLNFIVVYLAHCVSCLIIVLEYEFIYVFLVQDFFIFLFSISNIITMIIINICVLYLFEKRNVDEMIWEISKKKLNNKHFINLDN